MILKNPILLNENFNAILDELEKSQEHYFITGKAGTGKSTLLQLFRKSSRKKIAVLAPTGVAALNVRGQTIHSFFAFPPKLMDSRSIKKRKNRRLYKNLETIIIDEISMVRADILDHIDAFLRLNREIEEPFGGIQMIFFGDLFQLPPVVATQFEKHFFRTTYESPYFFNAKIIDQSAIELRYIEMTKVFRQEERGFIRLLDNIRQGTCDYDDLEYLNSRTNPHFQRNEGYITLCSLNAIADRINKTELSKIEKDAYSYQARIDGLFEPRLYPTDFSLNLKIGAQVMLLKNDQGKRFVNGSIAIIETLTMDNVGISLLDESGKRQFIELEKANWEILKYKVSAENPSEINTEVVGIFNQFPIKLAWAVTIHKSQGKTFENVIIDLGTGAFEHGQTYVALSRCKTFEGIILSKPIQMKDIWVDPLVIDFYDNKIR